MQTPSPDNHATTITYMLHSDSNNINNNKNNRNHTAHISSNRYRHWVRSLHLAPKHIVDPRL